MTSNHNVVPVQEHRACPFDLLGRAGCFDEWKEHLKMTDCKPGDLALNALLGVCKIRGNIKLGREVVEHLIELKP